MATEVSQMKLICATNCSPINLKEIIEIFAPRTGVGTQDFPPNFDWKAEVDLFVTVNADRMRPDEITQRAVRRWGDQLLKEHFVVLNFSLLNGNIRGMIGYFEIPAELGRRELVPFSPVHFKWLVFADASAIAAAVDEMKRLPWYSTTRFTNYAGNPGWSGRVIDREGIDFFASITETNQVREIETSIGELLKRRGLDSSQISPNACPTCNGIIKDKYYPCPKCEQEKQDKVQKANLIMKERRSRKECTMCGKKLGFIRRLAGAEKHSECKAFVP
jgi:hypothetical protein